MSQAHAPYRCSLANKRVGPMTLWVEPWGRDYTLLAGETVEVVADRVEDDFFFLFTFEEVDVLAWAMGGCADVLVYQDGREIACGHNRPARG